MEDENPPKTKINSFIASDINNKQTIKLIKIIFLLINIFITLDFGFIKYKSRKVKIIFKCISILQAISVCVMLSFYFYNKLEPFFFMWYFLYTTQYFHHVMILNFSNSNLYDFISNLHSIDAELKVDGESYSIATKFILMSAISIGYRGSLPYFYCSYYLEYCIPSLLIRFLYFIPLLCMHVVLLLFTFIFYSSYCRLNTFTSSVKNHNSDLSSCVDIYKSLIDTTENIKTAFSPMFVVALLCNLLDVMFTIYYSLIVTYSGKSSRNFIMSYISISEVLLLLFIPAFAAGMLSGQCEKLKLVLYDKLFQEKDRQRSNAIDRFIRYVEARPFKFSVAKIIPLDWSLPVSLLNITVTYLIVMIQFLHLY